MAREKKAVTPETHDLVSISAPVETICTCELVVEPDNTGGLAVSHPARLGGFVTGSFRGGEDYGPWRARVHAEES